MRLNDRLVKTISAKTSPRLVADQGTGLVLMIQALRTDGKPPTRTYYWRGQIAGKTTKFKIARVDAMKLTEARRIAISHTIEAASGGDPSLSAKIRKVSRTKPSDGFTVDQVWQLYKTAVVNQQKSGGEKNRIYEKDIKPLIGAALIKSVHRDDLRVLVRIVSERSQNVGRITAAYLSSFLKWCEEEGYVDDSPMFSKSWKPAPPRDRHLSGAELGFVLRACGALRDGYEVRGKRNDTIGRWAYAVEVLLRTGQRKSDILDLTLGEVTDGVITIPASRFKSGRKHVLPMPAQVAILLENVSRPDCTSDRYFQRLGQHTRSINTLRAKVNQIAGYEVPHWTLHSLRKTFDTQLREMWDETIDRCVADNNTIEVLLGHSISGVARHYNFSTMMREKRRVLNWYNDWLDRLVV